MKKSVIRSVAAILIAALLMTFSGCGESGKVKETIAALQKACNEKDVDGILACIDNPIINVIKGASGLAGDLFGTDIDDLIDTLGEYLDDILDLTSPDILETLRIKVSKVTVKDGKAYASALISGQGLGSGFSKNVVFECVQIGENWKIRNVTAA